MKTEKEINNIVGKNIKKYRYMYKITQKDLAKKIGTSLSLISKIENENIDKKINISTLYKISQTLKIPINKFFE